MRFPTSFADSSPCEVLALTILLITGDIIAGCPLSSHYQECYGYLRRTTHPSRIRQHGKDRSSPECLLGRSDAAVSPTLQYWTRHHAPGIDSRFWHPEKGLRTRQPGSRQTAR